MKKLLSAILASAMCLSLLASCGQTASPDENPAPATSPSNSNQPAVSTSYPERSITWYLAGGAGSGPDTLFRALIHQLENSEVMGQPLVPQNDMWANAIWACLDDKADGYAVTNIPTPNIFKRDLDPENDTDPSIDDLALICNVASYYGCIALRTDDTRFTDVNTLDQFVDWCKANPNESLLVGVKSAKGDDDICLYKLQNESGLTNDQLVRVHCSTASENLASMLGGTIDVLMINEVDVRSAAADGQLKLLAVFRDERSPFYPDIPTATECGYNVVGSVDMGIAMPPEVPAEIQETFADYVETVMNSAEFQAQLEQLGFSPNFIRGQDYRTYLEASRQEIADISGLLGWS